MEFFTQNSYNHIVLDDFHGTIADIIDITQSVAFVDEILSRSAEVRSDVQREQLEAALGGGLEYGQLQYFPVKMHRDVAPEFFGKFL